MTDAIVIGSGINGLGAAALLSEAGWGVTVLERGSAPGGAVQTREATLPGFRHDTGAMNLSLFAGSALHQRLGPKLARHGLAFAPVTDCFASAFPDGRWLGVSTDLDLTAARIGGQSPADAAAWRALHRAFPKRAEDLFALLGGPATPWALGRWAWGVSRRRSRSGLRELLQFLLQSPRAFLDATFESDRVKAMLAVWGMHLDFAPDQAGGALFPYLEAMANQSLGMVLGKGGAQTVTDALVGLIRANGGEVRCGAEVAHILKGPDGAKGVQLAGGEALRARRAVIANLTPAGLLRLLPKGTGSGRFDRAARAVRPGPGTLMLHLAVDRLPDWAAGPELKRFAYVHLAPSLHQMAETYAAAASGLLPREPVLVVGQPTAVDPSRAPAGKHILWVQVRMVPGEIRGDAAGEIGARDWAEAKAPMVTRVKAILERYAPGLSATILAEAAVDPDEFEADNPNLVGGDQIGGSHHLAQNFLNRPAPGWSDGSTPIPRLHLASAACWPGAGTGAGAGTLLADRLTRWRR